MTKKYIKSVSEDGTERYDEKIIASKYGVPTPIRKSLQKPIQQHRSTKMNYDAKKCTCNKFYNCNDCMDLMQLNKEHDVEVYAKAFEMFATVLKEERPDTMQAHEERGDLNAWNADTVDRVLKCLWTTGIGGGKPE